jgi:molecular chaperone GrpE
MRQSLEGLDPTSEAEMNAADIETAPDQASLLRALRDLEAAKGRVERDASRSAQELREKLVGELLPVLDNLDRTIAAAEQSAEAPSVVEGVRLVRSQFVQVLGRYGLERVDARHQPFDPNIHDAIATVAVSHPASHNVVIDQIEPGYRFERRIVRPAKVVVGRLAPRFH